MAVTKSRYGLFMLAGIFLLATDLSTAQPVKRGTKTATREGKACIWRGEGDSVIDQRAYLNVELKISQDGSFEIMRAVERSGSVTLNTAPTSDLIYEVSHAQKTVAVAFLRDDPFTMRGFANPSSPHGETVKQQTTTTVVINIPDVNLSMLKKCHFGLRFYKLQPGARADKMDARAFQRLREEGGISPVLVLPPDKFTKALVKAGNPEQ